MDIYEHNKRVEILYNRLLACTSTSDRRNNYEQIAAALMICPELRKYWELQPNATYYVDRVIRINDLYKPVASVLTLAQASTITYNNELTKIYNNHHYAYILWLEDHGQLKVGKSSKMYDRLNQLKRNYGSIEVYEVFEFDNEEDAYLMEVLLHKYYKKKYPSSFIPQDRFEEASYTTEDYKILIKVANEIKTKKWF